MEKCQFCSKRFVQLGSPLCWQCRAMLDADLRRSFVLDRQLAEVELKRQAQENYEALLEFTTKTDFFGIKQI